MRKSIVLFVLALWGIFSIINLFQTPKVFSEMENRILQKFPELSIDEFFEGTFTTDFENYFNDQILLRNDFIRLKNTVDLAFGRFENHNVYYKDGILTNQILEPKEEYVKNNIASILKYTNGLKNVDFMLVPPAELIQKNRLPHFAYSWDQAKYIEMIQDQLKENLIDTIDLMSTLKPYSNEYLYYYTDHHWTLKGALHAYNAFATSNNLELINESTLKERSNAFLGTTYSRFSVKTKLDTIYEYPIQYPMTLEVIGKDQLHSSIYFEDFLSKKDKYAFYTGTNEGLTTIKVDNHKNKKIIVFKDSYAHSIIPFLTNEFSEITMVDLRYINKTTLPHALHDYDQVLFLYSLDTFIHENDLSMIEIKVGK